MRFYTAVERGDQKWSPLFLIILPTYLYSCLWAIDRTRSTCTQEGNIITGKKNPQFQGVSVSDRDDEYITGAMAERKGMDLVVYAHVPADPDLEVQAMYSIRSTTPEVVLQATYERMEDLAYYFSQVRLAR